MLKDQGCVYMEYVTISTNPQQVIYMVYGIESLFSTTYWKTGSENKAMMWQWWEDKRWLAFRSFIRTQISL